MIRFLDFIAMFSTFTNQNTRLTPNKLDARRITKSYLSFDAILILRYDDIEICQLNEPEYLNKNGRKQDKGRPPIKVHDATTMDNIVKDYANLILLYFLGNFHLNNKEKCPDLTPTI